MARVKKHAHKSTLNGDSCAQEHANPAPVTVRVPVSVVPGAMYGYCPKCSAPVVCRDKPAGDKWGKDRCQMGHSFPSMDAMPRPLVPPPVNNKKVIKKRGRNK